MTERTRWSRIVGSSKYLGDLPEQPDGFVGGRGVGSGHTLQLAAGVTIHRRQRDVEQIQHAVGEPNQLVADGCGQNLIAAGPFKSSDRLPRHPPPQLRQVTDPVRVHPAEIESVCPEGAQQCEPVQMFSNHDWNRSRCRAAEPHQASHAHLVVDGEQPIELHPHLGVELRNDPQIGLLGGALPSSNHGTFHRGDPWAHQTFGQYPITGQSE